MRLKIWVFLVISLINSSIGSPVNMQLNKFFSSYNLTNALPHIRYRTNNVGDEFDFIVVGSGAAGSVIANRLSEVSQWKVLLLEAGEEPFILTDIPGLAPYFLFTNHNWGYLMEKQDGFGMGLIDQQVHWPRGKVLGGSSVINYMMHIRGNREDYDRWAALGNPGWSYEEVLPYFKKSENSTVKIQDEGYHNDGGYLNVGDVPYRSESATVFVKAAGEVGYDYVDYNGRNQLGVSYVQGTLREGLRCSAEKAFLQPAKHRPNLTILTKSRVTKILIDATTKRAYGVVYVRNKRNYRAKASKEVILSAGTFNSPQLLMLTGIGPKEHLEELGIKVVQNLPVGQKLYDHIIFLGLVFTVNQSIVVPYNVMLNVSNYYQFFVNRKGPFTSIGGVEAVAYFKSVLADYKESYPDIELIFIGGGLHSDHRVVYSRMFRVNDEFYNKIWKPIENTYAWSVFPLLLHPKSYGFMKLKSKNPFHWPKLHGKYLSDPDDHDMKAFVAAIREVQKIAASPAFQKYGTQQLKTLVPGCEGYKFDSDSYWECAIRALTVTQHHQSTTCKMGPVTDPEAVVDSRLRVHGIKSLRVADTSIIPITLSAHTNVPAYMIGEKASDFIKSDWL